MVLSLSLFGDDLYRTLQKQRPSTKSRKSCRTVLFYGVFELFWRASIMKMTQKMMDGFIRDTICHKNADLSTDAPQIAEYK